MINDLAHQAVRASTFGPDHCFRRPLYGSYGFNRLPATLEFLLTGSRAALEAGLPADVLGAFARRFEAIVLLLVDGFGWHLFQRYAPQFPFLRRFLEQGVCSPMTAQFPSTTAAHMTTLHTGLPVSQSGVLEWFYYEPAVDAVIAPLLYALAGEREREGLRARVPDPEAILPGPRLYRRLAEQGIATTAFQPDKYSDSTYSVTMFAGARRCGYPSLADGIDELARCLLQEAGRRYYFFYIDGIDARSHSHGLDSPEFEEQVAATFALLEERFFGRVTGQPNDLLVVMSADHGQVPVNTHPPDYVNLLLPDLPGKLRRGRDGPICFAGSARDLFLYVEEAHLPEVERRLGEALAGRAEVWRCEPLTGGGLFGPPPFDRLRPRLGNLLVLPHAGHSAFWFEQGKFWMRHKGSHGGLTPGEMDTGVYLLRP